MSINTVLFDLDGTLLPMDQDVFVGTYFSHLAQKLEPYGYEKKKLLDSIWAGVAAMVKNDGLCTNEQIFWKSFCAVHGEEAINDLPLLEDFYRNEFQKAKGVCGFTPKAKETVQLLKNKGYRVILATNPIFPAIATESRIRWAGLEPEDFDFYTTYENSTCSKPNPAYYLEILGKIGARPDECIMVGNDVAEDMIAEKLGMKVFLLPECIINKDNKDISSYPNGNFDDLINYINSQR